MHQTLHRVIIRAIFEKRTYNLTPKQIFTASQKFKQNAQFRKRTHLVSKTQGGGYPDTTGTILLDSASWLVESTLNIDYDYGGDQNSVPTTVDSTSFSSLVSYDSSTGEINNSDAADVYNYFSDYCAAIFAAGNSIKVIDMYTTKTADGVLFSTNIVVLNGKPGYPYVANCDPFATQSALWSVMYAGVGSGGCSSNTVDAPTLIQNRLNCQNTNGLGCYNGRVIFLNPVTLPIFYSTSSCNYPSALYCNTTNTACDPTVLNATQLNGFVTGCVSLATSNTPSWGSLSPGYTIANYNVIPFLIGSFITVEHSWNLKMTYARAFCSLSFYQ